MINRCIQSCWIAVGACLAMGCLGCQNEAGPPKVAANSGASGSSGAATPVEGPGPRQPAHSGEARREPADSPINEALPAPQPIAAPPAATVAAPAMPQVSLLKADRDTCVVFLGDAMPDGVLKGLDGTARPLRGLLGQKATVVCLWTTGQPPYGPMQAKALLSDLESGYSRAMAEQGLKVIGINVGQPAQAVGPLAQEAGVTFATLVDPEGDFFQKVAKEKLPRLYVLDTAGTIRWLDVEYSQSTRERLDQAVRAVLDGP